MIQTAQLRDPQTTANVELSLDLFESLKHLRSH